MDPGIKTPFLDCFRRGEVEREVRRLAARGAVALAALEQLALLVMLLDDKDLEIQSLAADTVRKIPTAALASFLARPEVPGVLREFFKQRGIEPAATPAPEANEPLIDPEPETPAQPDTQTPAPKKDVFGLPIVEKIKLAMKGTREQRGQLIRDGNRMVAASVLSSPKLSETEVEGYARMSNVSDDVLRLIGSNRSWTKSYLITAALARNPKTPLAISLRLVSRLNVRDLKTITRDRNVQEAVRKACKGALETSASRG
jgi:hypothetical protein